VPTKTAKPIRLEQDLQKIVSTFDEVKLPINNNSVKDFFRLRKYKPDAQHPQPILVKFLRSADASLVLSKGSSFKAPIHIKPGFTPEERKIENYLLKECWSLIQLGFERKRIKLRNKNIFIDNKLYGQYLNSEFQRTQYNPPLNTANLSASADLTSSRSAAPDTTSKINDY